MDRFLSCGACEVKEIRDDLCLRIVYPSLSEKARDETIIFCEKHVFENVLALINRTTKQKSEKMTAQKAGLERQN